MKAASWVPGDLPRATLLPLSNSSQFQVLAWPSGYSLILGSSMTSQYDIQDQHMLVICACHSRSAITALGRWLASGLADGIFYVPFYSISPDGSSPTSGCRQERKPLRNAVSALVDGYRSRSC